MLRKLTAHLILPDILLRFGWEFEQYVKTFVREAERLSLIDTIMPKQLMTALRDSVPSVVSALSAPATPSS